MSSTFQIVQPDGRVGPHISIEDVVSQIAHGRVLGFDLLRSADGSVSSVSDHAACARIMSVLAKRSASGSRAVLAAQIGSIHRSAGSGRLLVWSNSQTRQRAFAFRDGYLVGARSSVSGEIESTGETPQHRAGRAAAMIEILGHVLADASTHFSFIEDPDIADSEVSAWFPARSALETALYASVPVTELWNSAEMLGTTQKNDDIGQKGLDSKDQQIVLKFDGQDVSRESVAHIAHGLSCSVDDVLIRLHTLVALGALKGQTASAPILRRTAQQLEESNYFDMLELSLTATPEEVEETFGQRMESLGAIEQSDDDQAIRSARRQIKTLLEAARDTLSDPHLRTIYQRAQQLGLDFQDQTIREKLLKEHLLSFAQKKLDGSQFEEAKEALNRVARIHPDDEDVHIKLGWASFLSSDRSESDANEAAIKIDQALALNKESDIAYLTLGKIYRLANVRDKALRHLKKATDLNPENSEAWALLRNVNTQKGGPATGALKLQLEVSDGLMPVMAITLFVMAILYVGANTIAGGPTEWPRVGSGASASTGANKNANKYETALAKKVRKRLEGEVDYSIPSQKQVLGSVESYYLVDDAWFWGRRGVLLVFALIGIFGVSRKNLGSVPIMGTQPLLMFVAIPYGIIVGFLSPMPATPTNLEALLGMTAFHVLAEQLFFFGFVGRALFKSIDSPVVAISAAALIFGAYHFTYFGTMQSDPAIMLMGVAQIGAFAGGAYAALWYFSGGLFAPILAHLLINGTMMFRTVQQYAA